MLISTHAHAVTQVTCALQPDLGAMQEYPMFHTSDGRKVIENLAEFDDAREVVAGLAAEYQACERPDYVSAPHTASTQCCTDSNQKPRV